jgi:pimeloyl-ACP methyl ester carboxylesterase
METIYQILLLLLAIYLLAAVWIYFLQEKQIFRPRKLPPDADLELEEPHGERWFRVEGGVHLNAAHLKRADPHGLIIYHHGNSGDLSEWKKVASLLLPHGFDVLVYDYRGYGKSGGRIRSEEELFHDGERIYQAMREEYGEDRILLYGRSLGSGIASYLAAHYHPASLLLETPFYSMKQLVRQYYPWLPNFLILRYPFRNDLYLKKVDCPIHIFHGDRDRVIDLRSTFKLKELLKPGDRFYTIPGGHHADLSEFREYHDALKEALNAYKSSPDQTGKVRSAS